MNHKRKSRLSGSYVALTKVPEPGNERDSTILSAPLGDGCLRTAIVDRERAGALRHHSALRPAGCSRRRGAFPSDRTCAAWYSNRISPAIHRISNFEVLMTCVDSPVAGSTFREKAVLLDEWKGAAVAVDRCISSVLSGRDSAMTEVSFLAKEGAPLLTHNVYGAPDEVVL